jgi:hypothetical protein
VGPRARRESCADTGNAPNALYFIALLPKHFVDPSGDNPVKADIMFPRNL